MNQATRSIILISSLAILPFCTKSLAATAAIDPARVVFIKADDFKGIDNYTQKWTDFLQASRDIGIQVGLGVIVEHIDGKASTHQWMRDQVAQGDVEFWNHGWDHNRTTMTDGTTVYEFSGTGLTHMREHMLWAQAGLKEALGQDAVTFGTPYNQFDSDAATVVNETTALRVLFSRSTIPLDARVSVVNIISELDGTGKPNAAKFEERYPSGPAGPVSLQFHPTAFDSTGLTEYTNIVQSLQDKGYTVM
ncbi:MAG TPA: polysaccharide deacetylase family protein, partial [Tichowtungia sp.]|nr:polysaccharide deacetylase family protein [Tichowtungia sp.]